MAEVEIGIAGKIMSKHDEIQQDPLGAGKTEANRLGKLAIKAIVGGMGSDNWREYMSNFVSSQRQLDRLCGEDGYITTEYGEECLAYIAANSTCTVETGRNGNRGTLNFVKTDAISKLDKWDQ